MPENDWRPPTLPDVKNDFNEVAHHNHQVERPVTDDAEQQRRIATAAELQALEQERKQPVLEQHLTIGGTTEQEVHRQVNDAHEAKIKELRERLHRHNLTERFNQASRGRSR